MMTNQTPLRCSEIGMVGLGVMGRNIVLNIADHGFPVAGYDKDTAKIDASALMLFHGYLDSDRSAVLPTNLIQAQRDYFGAHTYERTDAAGTFHTEWDKEMAL